jgi:hypothetical protein
LSRLIVDDDVIGMRNRLWPLGAIALAVGEDAMPVFFVADVEL